MRFRHKRGQLPGSPGQGRRPPARLGAPRGYSRDPAPQNRHRSPLFPWSRRLLPAICEKLRSHRRSPACCDQERRGLPLKRRLPNSLRPPQDAPHHQPHHCLPRLQPGFSVVHRRVDRRPRRNSGSSPRWQGAHHLLRFEVPQPG